MTAPAIDGNSAIPTRLGPQEPNSNCPTDEPTKPAKTLVITPIEPPLLVIPPATKPIRPPTTADMSLSSSFLKQRKEKLIKTILNNNKKIKI